MMSKDKVMAAALAIGNGTRVRVRIADLRERVAEFAHEAVTAALLDLQRDGKIVLYPINDPIDRTEADYDGAIRIGDSERHILYVV
jgi:hypothetical protein